MARTISKKDQPPRDPLREILETLVFVVALVLLLKLFVVEAFVIPTGSMAETLYGYHRKVICTECGFPFTVNSSREDEPQGDQRIRVVGGCCPNCNYVNEWSSASVPPEVGGGDRVLVHKALYEFAGPDRGDIVVFKYPVDLQYSHVAQNYIKRLWGFGGETIAIHRGDLYVNRSLAYPNSPMPSDPNERWIGPDAKSLSKTTPPFSPKDNPPGGGYLYLNDEAAIKSFRDYRSNPGAATSNGFEPIVKTNEQALAMRRIVYDNQHQSETLARAGIPPRWSADVMGWKTDVPITPRVFTHKGDDLHYLSYANRASYNYEDPRDSNDWFRINAGTGETLFQPTLIQNFLGYNTTIYLSQPMPSARYWVGDLMLECKATFSGATDEVVLDLAKGVNRYEARFTESTVTLQRLGPNVGIIGKADTGIDSGEHELRFANIDGRLRVWVDGSALEFDYGSDVVPVDEQALRLGVGAIAGAMFMPTPQGWTIYNDIGAPARIGAKGEVVIDEVRLWEDTYFTPYDDFPFNRPTDIYERAMTMTEPTVDTYFVQPGHYLCLGDNSGFSSDSRKWGVVPERLMLGKAFFVFFPLDRIGFIE